MWIPPDILQASLQMALVPYENLSKIVRYRQLGDAARAADGLPDRLESVLSRALPGEGGTCYATTWVLYRRLCDLGYRPRLLPGHKGNRRNEHCALVVPVEGGELFLDPGYLVFDPLPVPPEMLCAQWPLQPNAVELENREEYLIFRTGRYAGPNSGPNPALGSPIAGGYIDMKERYRFPLAGVDEVGFFAAWEESFVREMMLYPVLNRLDRAAGVQYYWQKANLVVRDSNGSTLRKVEPGQRLSTIVDIFGMDAGLVEQAFGLVGMEL